MAVLITCSVCLTYRLTVEDKPFTLKTEFKVEPHTLLKGEPVSLLPVKKEIKEEAIPMTKSETSAQSTTGMS